MENLKAQAVLSDIMESSSRTTTLTIDGLEFVVKFPSLLDKVKIGAKRVKLLDGANPEFVDVITDNTAYFLATLTTVVIKTPLSFNWDKLSDYVFISRLFELYTNWEQSFRTGDGANPDTESSGDSRHEAPVEDNEGVQPSN